MKQPQLKAGMDCTNLRTREGGKVVKVEDHRLVNYPFKVTLMVNEKEREWFSISHDGYYWDDCTTHRYDILELEEGDEGYIGERIELDDSIDRELMEVLNSSLSATLKIKFIKLILIP